MSRVACTDPSRLPWRDEDGRVPADGCRVVEVTLMLPKALSRDEVRALLERLYEREPSVLHWTTNIVNAR